MNDGTRTHDGRNHNPGLYQLSYAHHKLFWHQKMVRPRGLEPLTYGLAYHYSFHCLRKFLNLWSGLYLHHLRWDTYSLYGSWRFPSLFYQLTLIRSGTAMSISSSHQFPRYCQRLHVRFHRYSILHFARSVSGRRLLRNNPDNNFNKKYVSGVS